MKDAEQIGSVTESIDNSSGRGRIPLTQCLTQSFNGFYWVSHLPSPF